MAATTTTLGGPVVGVLNRPVDRRHSHKNWTEPWGLDNPITLADPSGLDPPGCTALHQETCGHDPIHNPTHVGNDDDGGDDAASANTDNDPDNDVQVGYNTVNKTGTQPAIEYLIEILTSVPLGWDSWGTSETLATTQTLADLLGAAGGAVLGVDELDAPPTTNSKSGLGRRLRAVGHAVAKAGPLLIAFDWVLTYQSRDGETFWTRVRNTSIIVGGSTLVGVVSAGGCSRVGVPVPACIVYGGFMGYQASQGISSRFDGFVPTPTGGSLTW